MSEIFSLNAKKIIFLLLFCAVFACSAVFLIRLGIKNSSEKNSPSDTLPPETSKYHNAPTVIIDAGHGGEDGGTVGVNGTPEKQLNLQIALELDALLRAAGISTRLTRDTDILLYDRNSDYYGHKKEQDMQARLRIVEEYDNAVFISIHMNSFSQSKYKGLQVYYSSNSPESARLAEGIQALVRTRLQPQNDRKTKPSGGSIYLLDKISQPAVLIECGFLSNPEECELLATEEYRSRLCLVIYYAVIEHFEGYLTAQSDN